MSRVGKKIIKLPAQVKVKQNGNHVTVEGPKGTLSAIIPAEVKIINTEEGLSVQTAEETRRAFEFHGLCRTLIANMVEGVSSGFLKKLEINGVGYRAEVSGSNLSLSLGFSHQINMDIPQGLQIKSEKGKSTVESGQDAVFVTITGIDKELVGGFAAKIRAFKKPEPYKGKGVKYFDEKIERKEGKVGAK